MGDSSRRVCLVRLRTGYAGQLVLELESQEVSILGNLVGQLMSLLQSHRDIDMDPDPLMARLEIGGTDHLPDDPALARLLPNAYEDDETSNAFRRLTEQGLVNQKMEDAMTVSIAVSAGAPGNAHPDSSEGSEVTINAETLGPWVRTLTALRLSIAARLGIKGDDDYTQRAEQSEHANTIIIYDWLAAIIDLMIRYSEVLGEDAGE